MPKSFTDVLHLYKLQMKSWTSVFLLSDFFLIVVLYLIHEYCAYNDVFVYKSFLRSSFGENH